MKIEIISRFTTRFSRAIDESVRDNGSNAPAYRVIMVPVKNGTAIDLGVLTVTEIKTEIPYSGDSHDRMPDRNRRTSIELQSPDFIGD